MSRLSITQREAIRALHDKPGATVAAATSESLLFRGLITRGSRASGYQLTARGEQVYRQSMVGGDGR